MIPRELIFPKPNWPALVFNPQPVILDIGANDGGTSFVFQHWFPNGKVYAFEPDPRAISHCKLRLSSGNIDGGRFELFEGAVSDVCGEADFFLSDGADPNFKWYDSGYDLSGSLLKPVSETPFDVPTIYFKNKIKVKTITLDSWTKEKSFANIDILWMDVQGAEGRVLTGGKETIKMVNFIYLECEDKKTYEGQPDLQTLCALLDDFELLISYDDGNHLFKNRKMK